MLNKFIYADRSNIVNEKIYILLTYVLQQWQTGAPSKLPKERGGPVTVISVRLFDKANLCVVDSTVCGTFDLGGP